MLNLPTHFPIKCCTTGNCRDRGLVEFSLHTPAPFRCPCFSISKWKQAFFVEIGDYYWGAETQFTFNSVRSNDIKPKFRPENSAEKHKQQQIIMMANQTGTNISIEPIDSHFSVPWCMNGMAVLIFCKRNIRN